MLSLATVPHELPMYLYVLAPITLSAFSTSFLDNQATSETLNPIIFLSSQVQAQNFVLGMAHIAAAY